MRNNPLRRRIFRDCIRAELIPMGFYICSENIESLLTVYTAGVLGTFADAVFRLDFTAGMDNLLTLILCLGITVLLLPVLGCIGEMLELRYALVYERLVLGHFLDKEYASVIRYPLGDIQQRLDWDPIDLRCGCCRLITDSVWIVVTTAALLYTALRVSPLFTGIMFAITILKLTVPAAVRKLEKKYDREKRQYQDTVRRMETEITAAPHQVKLFGLTRPFIARLEETFQSYYRTTAGKSIRCSQIAGGISGFLGTFCTVLLLFTGALLTAAGKITPGTIAAMFGYFSVCGSIVDRIGTQIREWPKIQNSAERMELFYEDPEPQEGEDLPQIGEITAEHLGFAYGDTPVLQNVSFRWKPGEKLAIIGPNGSGKSTLVKLLCGLLKGYTGSIRVNGRELSALALPGWRKYLAYAPQDPLLFTGTVRENVRLGVPEPMRECTDIDPILETLGISYLADRMLEFGKDTLSGGEKQKVSIARALARNTPLLILDEPGNHLDAETLSWLADFIRTSDRSIVYISHDPVLTAAADGYIELEK